MEHAVGNAAPSNPRSPKRRRIKARNASFDQKNISAHTLAFAATHRASGPWAEAKTSPAGGSGVQFEPFVMVMGTYIWMVQRSVIDPDELVDDPEPEPALLARQARLRRIVAWV